MDALPNELVEAILGLAGGATARSWYVVHDPLELLVGRLRLASVCCLWRDLLHHRLLQSVGPSPSHAAPLQTAGETASWIIARQQCKEMWECTWRELKPLIKSARDPVGMRKRIVLKLLRQARVWHGDGPRERSTASLQEWAATRQPDVEEQLQPQPQPQPQIQLSSGTSTQLSDGHHPLSDDESSGDIPLYLQGPWRELQGFAAQLLSSLKITTYQPHSVLGHIVVYGPKGCGKTTLVRYLAAELGLPLLQFECPRIKSLENEFGVELGTVLMRDVFSLARKRRPCIMLLHKYDALSRIYKQSKLENQATTEIDGLSFREPPVFIIGETSEPQRTSASLYRRMINWVHIGLPDVSARRTILRECLEQRGVPVGYLQLLEMTFKTEGLSVTDLIQLCDDVLAASLYTGSVLHSATAENTAKQVDTIKRFDPCWLNDQYLQGWGGYGLRQVSSWNGDGTRRDGQLCPHHHQHLGQPATLLPFAFDSSVSVIDPDDDLYS